jgi:hypothetical protein
MRESNPTPNPTPKRGGEKSRNWVFQDAKYPEIPNFAAFPVKECKNG